MLTEGTFGFTATTFGPRFSSGPLSWAENIDSYQALKHNNNDPEEGSEMPLAVTWFQVTPSGKA
ncbi:uncharacterized protein ACLA_096620 [Aspergillus clavatus NRRL 1]|uniref:Uncharacterized protein n=1 Tax=Aspergillus clavatus (strain ATCC 1007 / CBS 513.65 / DSM 816 / NCTC 3887 / NRRL 1 / QM 1276 / 107) TaxID=344612 RepID=A1CME2_ASPCL|nr:uncharacterized protein ACLA_096620 [Aspergillus clavatus NRRL 1]EAW08729.1 hypothetical protein ACLA_096620 [Aspergillus clavatus NRRL 1]